MRKLILLLTVFTLLSCSKDNDEECEDLHNNYIQALYYSGGNQAAIDEINRQYDERSDDLGCD